MNSSSSVRKFSLHPKLAAVIDLLLNFATLILFPQLGSWLWFVGWFLLRSILWVIFIRLVYYPPDLSRWRHFWSLVFLNFGLIVSLSIFVEWKIAWYLLMTIFIFFSCASFWLLPTGTDKLTFYRKPFRRWLFLMDAFGLAGFWSGIYALMQFQLLRPNYFIWLELFGAIVSAFLAYWWWRAYGLEKNKRLLLSVVAVLVLVFELAWVVSRWPLGFMVSGLIIIWFWYICWLLIRFNLMPEGVDWKKQKFFIYSNIILFIIFVFLSKWT